MQPGVHSQVRDRDWQKLSQNIHNRIQFSFPFCPCPKCQSSSVTTGSLVIPPRIKKPAYFPVQLYYRKAHLLLWMWVSYKAVYPTGHHHHHHLPRLSSSFSSLCCLQSAEITHLVPSRTLICLKNFRLRLPHQLFEQHIPLAVLKSFYQNSMNAPHKRITAITVKTALEKQVASAPFKSRRIPQSCQTGLSYLTVPLLKLSTTIEASVKTNSLKYLCFCHIPKPNHFFLWHPREGELLWLQPTQSPGCWNSTLVFNVPSLTNNGDISHHTDSCSVGRLHQVSSSPWVS